MEKRWPGRTDPHVIWDDYGRYRGDIAFDVGANIGQIAKLLAPNFSKVISFEPCEESYAILSSEMPENVTAVPWAVSDHNGTVTLMEAEESIKTGQLVTREGLHWGPLVGSRQIVCNTLDHAAEVYGMPDFVKVDTEGHEVQVLRGAPGVIAERPRWLIEVHHQESGEEILEMLAGYEIQQVGHQHREGSVLANHYWIHAW